MLNRTRIFKNKIKDMEYVEDMVSLLKDKYSDKKACILAPGPSLKSHDVDKLNSVLSRNDIVVLSIKQAYDWTKENTDFHIMNTWNFKKEVGYDYVDDDTIVFFGLTKAYVQAQMEKIAVKPSVCDFWIPISTYPWHVESDSIQATRNYDLFFQLGTDLEMRWGRSIIYEQAIPLALHMGCKDIFTIGWDIGNPKLGANQGHAYSYETIKPIESDPDDIQEAIDSTKELYDWFTKHDINFRILSDTNPADDRFERIKTLEDI